MGRRPASGLPVVAACVLLGACGLEEYRNADLQLDVVGAPASDEDRVRICVSGVGNREQALGAGRLAFAGLPAGEAAEVTVDLLDAEGEARLGRAGPVVLDADEPWARTGWQDCTEDCVACVASGERAPAGEADWLLAVRLEEDT